MGTFVLVHGSWHGAWCWERLIPLLERGGHRVVAPDLPGHGRDRTSLSAQPSEDYVARVVATLDAEDASAIVVGHSSGGMIIAAAAERRPERIAALVYLAAFLLPPGVTPPEVMRDDAESRLAAALVVDRARRTIAVRPELAREVFYGDCSDADAAWAVARLAPEPLIPPAAATAAPAEVAPASLPRFYIETLRDRALGPATQRRMVAALPCRRVYSLATDHSPFLSAPERLAACLVEIAGAVV